MKDITIRPNITIRQAMKLLDKTAEKCLLVIDDNKKLLGTLTDGDLRRSILSGAPFSEDISGSFFPKPTTLIANKFNPDEAKRLLREKKLDLLPVLDGARRVVNYITWSGLSAVPVLQRNLDDISVVIMAGGKGTRMEPFTKVLPKSLVPIHEKPVIEHIIERFTDVGCSDFHLTVNYKGRILKAYFEELQPDYKVNFVEEREPLGTAGSLFYLEGQLTKPFFVTNCDILIRAF